MVGKMFDSGNGHDSVKCKVKYLGKILLNSLQVVGVLGPQTDMRNYNPGQSSYDVPNQNTEATLINLDQLKEFY